MKKTLLSISAFVLLLSACKKDEDKPAAEDWYLSKYTYITVGRTDTITTTVKLGTNNLISELKESGMDGATPWSTLSQSLFEGNKFTTLKYTRDGDITPLIVNSVEYTGDKVAKINYYGSNATQEWGITGYHEMVYNDQGKVKEIRTKGVPNDKYATLYKLTWEGENVKSVTVFNVNGTDTSQANTTNFTYDAKPGIHWSLFPKGYAWWASPTAVENFSANNVVKTEILYNQELYTRITYERTFNSRGQVTEQKEKVESLREPIEVKNTITAFTYTKK